MDFEDPFDNFGLDFSSTHRYVLSGQGQSPDHAIEYANLLSSDIQPSLHGSPASNEIQHSPAHGSLLFLAGYPNPEQIKKLNKEHNVNPEFWRRHLESILTASAPIFEDVKLPSAACGVIQLRFWTIGSRSNSTSDNQASLESIRKDAEARMEKYRERLRLGAELQPGDSVVRGYEVHDRKYFSIEQVMTIYLAEDVDKSISRESKWVAIVCSDCGRYLHESPVGPWIGSHLPGSAEYHTNTFPVPEHQLWTFAPNGAHSSIGRRTEAKVPLRALRQSLATLPDTYGIGQNKNVMHEDPMYALNRIFSFFVHSEAHVLSFLSEQIKTYSLTNGETSDFADPEALSNLLHCRRLLEHHIEEERYVLGIVRSRKASNTITEPTLLSLEQDLLYLIERAVTLRSRSETSINLSMNLAGIEEARRGVQQNRSLFRFTVIASIYVPLTFVASLFGMNFREFGQGELPIWVYFVVSMPVLIVSALFLFLKPQILINCYRYITKR